MGNTLEKRQDRWQKLIKLIYQGLYFVVVVELAQQSNPNLIKELHQKIYDEQ